MNKIEDKEQEDHSTSENNEYLADAIAWNSVSDEIEELKKIFFEFVKTWSGEKILGRTKEKFLYYYKYPGAHAIVDDRFLSNEPILPLETSIIEE